MELYSGVIHYIVNLSLKLKKRTIRVITDSGIRDSCHDLFKKLQNLPLFSQYTYSFIMFVVKNRDLFELNTHIHKISTRYDNDFHLPSVQLKLFQKRVFYSGIKHTTTFHWLSRSCRMMLNNVDRFWKDLFIQTPFILWNSILTLTGNEWYSVCCKLIIWLL
jgi:hypothetical protein